MLNFHIFWGTESLQGLRKCFLFLFENVLPDTNNNLIKVEDFKRKQKMKPEYCPCHLNRVNVQNVECIYRRVSV